MALASGSVCAQTTENDFSELNDFVSVDTLKYPQVANSGFEMWDSEEINEPVSWNSFMTADGVFSDFVKIQWCGILFHQRGLQVKTAAVCE